MNNDALNEYISKLNTEQQRAATYGTGGVLVLAAAGSGKTSTLTSRIAYLISEKGIASHNILAVTFTNKAAKEMNQRLYKMGVDTKTLWIGTFHGICNKILRYHAVEAGLKKNFYIMDQQEQLSFLKRALRANEYDPKTINVDELQDKINNYKEVGWRSDQLRIGSQERKFYEIYEQACINDNCVDFAELMLGCYQLFLKNPAIEEAYAEKFQYILVDEFQDTNELQYKWLSKLASKHGNIFAVGDDDQCLPKGTVITTSKGKEAIENIMVGDIILSKIGNKLVNKKVTDKFEKEYAGNLIEIKLDNETIIQSTPEHVWFADLLNSSININDIVLTLCSENEENNALHCLEYLTNLEVNKTILENNGFNIEHYKEAHLFRLILTSMDYGVLVKQADILKSLLLDVNIICKGKIHSKRLLQTQARDIIPGMIMIDENGKERVVISVETKKVSTIVYDLNIENTHNYIANGIVTHNSIYGFRGAKPENLNLFKRDFNAELIKIEKNYRSDAYILDAANAIIKNNTNRQGKNLVATKPGKQFIGMYAAFNDEQESMFIATEMKKLRRALIPYKQMAILYRTNAQSRSLEKALNAQNIPYIVYGGFRFFDRQEVKHAMAYLRLAHNENDNMAFLRVANMPARAIGETALRKLEVLATEKKCSLYEMAKMLDAKTYKKYEPFILVIDTIRAYCKKKTLPDMVRVVLEHSGLEKMYEDDKKDGEERLDNLYELISAAEVFNAENPHSDIDEFLAFSTLDSDVKTNKRDENIDAVKLMTVHSSKGLEFDAVFIAGLEESLFPHSNSLGEASAIEEERRLMYVAITRAKAALYISYCEERLLHGQRNRFLKSRFLKELPNNIIQKLN